MRFRKVVPTKKGIIIRTSWMERDRYTDLLLTYGITRDGNLVFMLKKCWLSYNEEKNSFSRIFDQRVTWLDVNDIELIIARLQDLLEQGKKAWKRVNKAKSKVITFEDDEEFDKEVFGGNPNE